MFPFLDYLGIKVQLYLSYFASCIWVHTSALHSLLQRHIFTSLWTLLEEWTQNTFSLIWCFYDSSLVWRFYCSKVMCIYINPRVHFIISVCDQVCKYVETSVCTDIISWKVLKFCIKHLKYRHVVKFQLTCSLCCLFYYLWPLLHCCCDRSTDECGRFSVIEGSLTLSSGSQAQAFCHTQNKPPGGVLLSQAHLLFTLYLSLSCSRK